MRTSFFIHCKRIASSFQPSSVMPDATQTTETDDMVLSLINQDIRSFVDDEADAARSATTLNLLTFLSVRDPSAAEQEGGKSSSKTYSQRLRDVMHPSAPTNVLRHDASSSDEEKDEFEERLGALEAVKDAFVENLEAAVTKKPSLPPSIALDAVFAACEKVALQQMAYVMDRDLSTSMKRKLSSWIDEVTEDVRKRVPFPADGEGGGSEGSGSRYVTDLEGHLDRCQAVVDAWSDRVMKDSLNRSVLDEWQPVPVMKHVLRPYFTMLFLRAFIPGGRAGGHVRGNHAFHPSFLDSQYAGLAVYRVVFDTLMHMRGLYRTKVETEDADAGVLTKLDVMSAAVSEAMFRDHIDPSAKNTDVVFRRVNDSSQDTKQLSKELFQLSQEYEKRKHNLSVMTHTREQVRERAARLRTLFVWTVGFYLLTMAVVVSLYVTRRYTMLSVFSGVVAAAVLLWYAIGFLMRVFSQRGRRQQ